MWEVFTCGKVPYGRMKNSEVADMVQKGQVLEKPKGCLNEIYNVSRLAYNLRICVYFIMDCLPLVACFREAQL